MTKMIERIEAESGGRHYEAEAPESLDLTARARLALNGLAGSVDPALLTMWGTITFCTARPFRSHWASAETLLDPKFAESFTLMRVMSGSRAHAELEARYREAICSRIEGGLYWDRFSAERPWRNSYAPAFYGQGKDEDFATLPGAGRLLRTLQIWRELGDGSAETEARIRDLVAGLRRIAVERGDYCYYPEKGGWGEPCSYPRSGWLNTDEAQGETEGGEGSVVCMQGHQLYGAAMWHAETGDATALDLAARLTRYVMLPRFWGGVPDPDRERARAQKLPGHIAARLPDPPFTAGHELGHWYSHFHARAIALRGVLEYARAAGDHRAAEFVQRAYEFTLTQGIARMGWVNTYPGAADTMEGCALGDLVALGIRLTDLGMGDYWDQVDGLTRNQLVEQQLVDGPALERIVAQFREAPAPDEPWPGMRCYDEVIPRSLGTFAGMSLPTSLPSPWVMHCCTSNATQGMYYAWEGILREAGEAAQVNLLLNRCGALLDVHSWLPWEGRVELRIKAARRAAVRVPAWVRTEAVRVAVDGQAATPHWVGRYVEVGELRPGSTVTVTFPVPEIRARYTSNAHTPQEQGYQCSFRGSTLMDIAPRDERPSSYPIYRREGQRADACRVAAQPRFVPDRVVRRW